MDEPVAQKLAARLAQVGWLDWAVAGLLGFFQFYFLHEGWKRQEAKRDSVG